MFLFSIREEKGFAAVLYVREYCAKKTCVSRRPPQQSAVSRRHHDDFFRQPYTRLVFTLGDAALYAHRISCARRMFAVLKCDFFLSGCRFGGNSVESCGLCLGAFFAREKGEKESESVLRPGNSATALEVFIVNIFAGARASCTKVGRFVMARVL